MTTEVSLSSLMQLQLQLPGALDLVGAGPAAEAGGPGPEGAAADAAGLSSAQVSSDEQAARLRLQAPLPATVTNRVETAASALHSEGLFPAAGRVRAEPSGMRSGAAVNELNLTPVTAAALHAGAAQMQPQEGAVPADEAAIRRRRRDSQNDGHQGEEGTGQAEEGDTDRSEQKKRPPRSGIRSVAGDDGRVLEGALEPSLATQDEALFADILDALVSGRQSDILRQLQGSRRIVAVLPFNDPGELRCAARAYLLWRDAAGVGQVAGLAARLSWAKPPRSADWITVRSYKDRAANSAWRLRVQSTVPGPRAAAIQMGTAPMLPGAWTEVCLHIPDASRFWSSLGIQFSLQVAISTVPLHRWSSS